MYPTEHADRGGYGFFIPSSHIYVEASINHKPPLEFVFDTGATDVLDVGAAKAFDIPIQGALPGGGFGNKVEDFGFAKVLSYAHHSLWLQPNALAATPEVFDRSGLWISRAADGGIAIAGALWC